MRKHSSISIDESLFNLAKFNRINVTQTLEEAIMLKAGRFKPIYDFITGCHKCQKTMTLSESNLLTIPLKEKGKPPEIIVLSCFCEDCQKPQKRDIWLLPEEKPWFIQSLCRIYAKISVEKEFIIFRIEDIVNAVKRV